MTGEARWPRFHYEIQLSELWQIVSLNYHISLSLARKFYGIIMVTIGFDRWNFYNKNRLFEQ